MLPCNMASYHRHSCCHIVGPLCNMSCRQKGCVLLTDGDGSAMLLRAVEAASEDRGMATAHLQLLQLLLHSSVPAQTQLLADAAQAHRYACLTLHRSLRLGRSGYVNHCHT